MSGILTQNSYGKSRVRMVKVIRRADRHDLIDISVDIALQGDFETAHTRGDNSNILPTDTMKNTVYALGRNHPLDSIESFALHLGRHFLETNKFIAAAHVHITQHGWQRADVSGSPHPHTFLMQSAEKQNCLCILDRTRSTIEAGIDDLVILKTADSGFSKFFRDKFTTLKDTDDRILGTSVAATWTYAHSDVDFAKCRTDIRTALIETFARHHSLSVQQTLYAMGEAALNACPSITRIHLSLPNKHCLLVDLTAFGLDNPNEIFVPVDEPHGLIEATVERR